MAKYRGSPKTRKSQNKKKEIQEEVESLAENIEKVIKNTFFDKENFSKILTSLKELVLQYPEDNQKLKLILSDTKLTSYEISTSDLVPKIFNFLLVKSQSNNQILKDFI